MSKLSPNFSLSELTKSQTAERKGIDNIPNADEIYNLTLLCENILQPIRNKFGSFIVSSGYRCPELSIDQLILECYTGGNSGWIHCSYVENGRKETLTYDKLNGYRSGLING